MQSSRKRKRWIWIVGGVIVLAIAAVFIIGRGMQQRLAEATAAPQTGDIVTAFIGDLSANATASGQVLSRREASLSFDAPGQVTAVYVGVGDTVAAGDRLIQLETADLTLNVATAEQTLRLREANLASLQEEAQAADIAAAEAAVASAQASLDDLLAGATAAEIALSEANLQASQASLWSASADLSGVQESVTAAQIQAAEAAVLAAQVNQQNAQEINEENPTEATHQALLEANQNLAAAQAQLDALLAGPDQAQLGSAQGSVAAAAARVDGSQADLNLLENGAAAAQIAAAESQLAQAEATLASLLAGATEEQILTAEAEVAQAQLSLADAEAALEKATLAAPFAGVVTAVYVSEGEFASGTVIELIDMAQLDVILEVDEVDIGRLAVGQPAVVTLEAWPDVEIASEVQLIAPRAQADANSALVTYNVHLRLEETEVPVRVGMTANASLTTAEYDDVLLVPNRAITVDRTTGTYTVNLVRGESVEEVEVTIGLRDGAYTQIVNGLQAGDELVVGNALPVFDFNSGSGPGNGPG